MNRFILFSQCVVLFALYQTVCAGNGPNSKEMRAAIVQALPSYGGGHLVVQEEFKLDEFQGRAHVYVISVFDNKNDDISDNDELTFKFVQPKKNALPELIGSLNAADMAVTSVDEASEKMTIKAGQTSYNLLFDVVEDIEEFQESIEKYK